jgi:DNA invertase Pin-like site-specific DNA recombinase
MKTAVEWLVEQYKKVGGISISMAEIAKEMEKQRIKNEREEAYNNGYANGQMDAFTN